MLYHNAKITRLKPLNIGLDKRKSESLNSLRPMWLRAAWELRTVIMNGWKSYEMEAAVKMMRGEEPFDGVELK